MSAAQQGRYLRGFNGNAWKGGKNTNAAGYVRIWQPEHSAAIDGYVYEHRLVMERVLGRLLLPEEVVHHVDGDKANNHPENLRLLDSQGLHVALHYQERRRRLCLSGA